MAGPKFLRLSPLDRLTPPALKEIELNSCGEYCPAAKLFTCVTLPPQNCHPVFASGTQCDIPATSLGSPSWVSGSGWTVLACMLCMLDFACLQLCVTHINV